MNMSNAEELLNKLAEFSAQRDLLEMDKRALLDSVKVPAEIEAAQVKASVKRAEIDRAYQDMVREISNASKMVAAELYKPELPAEYVAAMSAYETQVDDLRMQAAARIDQEARKAYELKNKVDADLQAATAEVFNALERRKMEIATEFGDKAAAVDDNIKRVTEQAKAAVIAEGRSVKGSVYHGVYVAGRVTWNTDMLDGMCALIPQLKDARKVGTASCTLRKI
jgi:hypothetical protein